jgi:hypothetical protein
VFFFLLFYARGGRAAAPPPTPLGAGFLGPKGLGMTDR